MNLATIYKEIINNPHTEKEVDELDWKPVKKIDYEVPEFKIPNLVRNYSAKDKLSKVLAFIDMHKHIRYAEGCTVMPVSCKNKRLKSICGTTMEVSRLIKFMKDIGLLKDEDTSYQFGANLSKYNKSKTYQYFVDNEVKIKKYCLDNNIYIYRERNYRESCVIDTVVNNISEFAFEPSQVRFNSKLHLLKPKGMPDDKFENLLERMLYENYPDLAHYQQLADKINDAYYLNSKDFEISYRPTYEWNREHTAVRKIGIRATNKLCSVSREDRKELLKELGLNLAKDVRSSVPRLSLSLTLGYWVPEDIDFYNLVWNQYLSIRESEIEIERDIDTVVNNIFNSDTREMLKYFTLPAYFDYNDYRFGNHTRAKMEHKYDKDEVFEEMSYLQQAVRKVTGNEYDSEIFYHESNIYMEVLARLLEDGYWVWQVYDSWYAKKEDTTQEEYEKYVTSLVADIANRYIREKGISNG